METISRTTLYEEIWAEPMTTVAERYGVSSNYLARICEQLKVPRPPRGYWARRAAGQIDDKPALTTLDPGDETDWIRGGGELYTRTPPSPVFTETETRSSPRGKRPRVHPILVDAQEEFLAEDEKRSDVPGYLNPKNHHLADLFVSRDSLQPAIRLANDLYLALEDRGHWVRLAPKEPHYRRGKFDFEEGKPPRDPYNSMDGWWPSRATLVFIGGVAFGLTIFEIAEKIEVMQDGHGGYRRVRGLGTRPKEGRDSTWDLRHLPNGRLAVFAYSPYNRVPWTQYWREQTRNELRALVPDIVSALEQMAPEVASGAQAADIKAKQDDERRDREELEKARAAADKRRNEAATASRKDFLQMVEQWATAERVSSFCKQLAERLPELPLEHRAGVEQRLAEAAALFGDRDVFAHFRKWRTPEDHFRAMPLDYWEQVQRMKAERG